jgi:4-hydroxy-tetrahydrodipicolinate synthase
MHELCAAALDGNRGEAERINGRLKPLHEALFLESNPIPVKWAVSELGLIPSGIRLPLTPLSASLHATVRQAMQEAGIL